MAITPPHRAAALEVVKMFANELLALCPWLEIVGDTIDAEQLRNGVMGVIGKDDPTKISTSFLQRHSISPQQKDKLS